MSDKSPWFDYVDLSKDDRNVLFSKAYLAAYRAAYARRINAKTAPFVNPLTTKNRGAKTAINKARLAADRLGMPYDHYCRFALKVSEDYCWPVLTLPNQLYSESMQALVADAWEDYIRDYLVLPDQKPQCSRYLSYIQKISQSRRNPHHLLYHLIKKNLLDLAQASDLFDADIIHKAIGLDV